ncbi:MAG: sigma-54-dependent Fis family transcriptional regulator [Bacteroidales bacterium]|nr:sigma-54-dependent Fis family transcriptional regulator [Bacteroidales bacterium]
MDSQELQILKNKFDIIGNDPAFNRALETAVKFAPTDLPVLITGESGTGKENLARIIHQYSARRGGAFIPVNCGAIPAGTVDSELFGHVKGAFTGATDSRIGFFEAADRGTIFLDEIGELPAATQVKLLRVLQSGEYMKVGSTKVEHTNVRIVCATNVNLDFALQKGTFRQDLYYRINAAQLRLPPLRERKDDIYLLFRKFTSDFSEKYGMCKVTLSHDAIDLLTAYRWPGNIRQLMNFTYAVTALESQKITPTSERIQLDAARLLPYIPHEEGPLLPAVYGGEDAPRSGMSVEEREIIYKAIRDLKDEIDAVKRLVLSGGAHYQIPAPESGKNHPAEDAEWQDPDEQVQEEPESLSVKKTEEELIRRALEKHDGNRKLAAKELGIAERSLYRKIPDDLKNKSKKK